MNTFLLPVAAPLVPIPNHQRGICDEVEIKLPPIYLCFHVGLVLPAISEDVL